jgi:hypothetical protein
MQEPTHELQPPETVRVRPRMKGGGLPVPPVLPLVAGLALLLGLSIGFGLAPRSPMADATLSRAGSSSPSSSVWPTGTPTTVPYPWATDWSITFIYSSPTFTPAPLPSGGLTMAQAVASAEKVWPFTDADIVSVRLLPGDQFGGDPSETSGWVWAVEIRGGGSTFCEGDPTATAPAATPTCLEAFTTILVDYRTGEMYFSITSDQRARVP